MHEAIDHLAEPPADVPLLGSVLGPVAVLVANRLAGALTGATALINELAEAARGARRAGCAWDRTRAQRGRALIASDIAVREAAGTARRST